MSESPEFLGLLTANVLKVVVEKIKAAIYSAGAPFIGLHRKLLQRNRSIIMALRYLVSTIFFILYSAAIIVGDSS